jgi:hypothetical protein
MTNFIALYRGDNITEAQMVAASCDPALVEIMTRLLLQAPPDAPDEVFASLEQGKRRALRLIKREAQHASQE